MAQSPKDAFSRTYHASPHYLAFFFIFILSTLTYLDIANHKFVTFDDNRIILKHIDSFEGVTIKNIKNIILDDYPREEPLIVRDLSYLINASLFGPLNAQGYLGGNLLLHMLASYLVFTLSLLLFPGRYWQAIITASLFAVHPVHVESVAWISSRKDTLYSCFFLSAFLVYAQFIKTDKTCLLLACSFLYIMALFSKSSAISYLPIALLYRYLLAPTKKWCWQEALHFLLLTTTSLLFMQWYAKVLTQYGLFDMQPSPSLFKVNPALWVLLNAEVITFYLGKLLYPKTLSVIYSSPSPNIIFTNLPDLMLSLATCTVLLFALYKINKLTDKRPLFLYLWFFVVLGPYLNWAGINIFVADRYLYLAAFAPMAAVSYLLTTLHAWCMLRSRTNGSLLILFTCFLCTLLLSRGIKATETWSNTATLWLNALKAAPYHAEPYIGLLDHELDVYYKNQGEAKGTAALANAKKIAGLGYRRFCPQDNCPPQATGILYYLAKIDYEEDNVADSARYLKQGLLLKPEDIHLNYLHIYLALKQYDYQGAQEDIALIRQQANPNEYGEILSKINNTLAPFIEEKLKGQ